MPALESSESLIPAPDGQGWLIEKTAATPAGIRALEQEHALLQRLPADLFAVPLGFDNDGQVAVLRSRIPCAVRLDERLDGPSLPASAALALCLSLARIVAALHREGQADRALTPQRFFVPADDESGRACLAQLGRLTRPSVEERVAGAVAWLDGDLHYIAPEQTGRMNRGIDHRADLYTLGVIFYRVLVGRLPFSGADGLALVHAHLSLPAPWPSSFLNGFEPAWEAVLHKLLAKHAEDRYQTADGLVLDLQRLSAHAQAGTRPEGFVPGTDDRSTQLIVPARLYGRAAERQAVLEGFATMVAGGKVLLLVAGPSGSGKSSLVNEVHKPITAARGSFVGGKFDQFQRDQPYVALLGALHELVHLLLAEDATVVAQWRAQLAAALEGEGRVLVDLLPEMLELIGEQPPLPDAEPAAAAARMKRVFQQFIRVLARSGHPLVIFLDDLQWADAASLHLLETLFVDARAGYLMVLGAYRDDAITPGHLLPDFLARIAEAGTEPRTLKIGALSVATVGQLLADTLHRPPGEVADLAATLHRQTAGNPFHLKVLLQSLADHALLAYDHPTQRWHWDAAAIAGRDAAGDVVDLVLATLRRLPASAAETLSRAAFLGASFRFDDLLASGDADEARLQEDLELLEQRRYVLRRHGQHDPRYHFQHDRIQEAAYRLCPVEARAARHLLIGERLAALEPQLERSERLFWLLQHLNHGPPTRRLLVLNQAAGLRAKRSLAYAAASRAFGLVCTQLDEALWQEDHGFAFSACFERATTLFLDGQVEPALDAIEQLLPRAQTPMEIARVHNLRMTLFIFQGRYADAMSAGRRALAALGLDFPQEDLAGHVARLVESVRVRFAAFGLERVVDQFEMRSSEMALAVQVMKGLQAASYGFDDLIYRGTVALSTEIAMTHGLCAESPYLLTGYGVMVWRRPGDEGLAVRLGHAALAIARRFGNKQSICQACEVMVGHLNHWSHPLAQSRELNRLGYEAGIESGERQFVSYTHAYHCFNLYQLGTPLPSLVEAAASYAEFARACSNSLAMDGLEAVQLIAGLLGAATQLGPQEELERIEPDVVAGWVSRSSTVAIVFYKVARAHLHLMMGEVALAEPLVAEVRRLDPAIAVAGMISVAAHRMLELLLAARRAQRAGADEALRAEALREFAACRVDIERWALGAPANFGHYPLMAQAEMALIERRPEDAITRLEAAFTIAQGAAVFDAVLIAERAAEFCYRIGATSRAASFLLQALQTSQGLGASRKSQDLMERHPLLSAAAVAASSRRSMGELELDRVLGIIAAFTRDIGLEALVEQLAKSLLELSGASGFALLLAGEGGEWRVRARMGLGGGSPELQFEDRPFDPDADADSADARLLPHRPIRGALASATMQVCEWPADMPQFAGDLYLMQRQPGAIVCLPVAVGSQAVGLIYLESALASGAFTPKGLRSVGILSSQIGISLLNAGLYERMERQVAQRTAALREANQSLETLAQTLRTLGDAGQQITSQLALADVLRALAKQTAALVQDTELAVFGPRGDDEAEAASLPGAGGRAASPEAAALASRAAGQRIELTDGAGTLLALPLAAGHRQVGVMSVRRRNGAPFDSRERLILRSLASYGAIALDNAAAYDDLDRALKRLHETQEQLVVTEKLAALGQLTAGVAHEIQNPLNFVNNFAEVSKDLVNELRSPQLSPALDVAALDVCRLLDTNLDTILANGRRMSAIVRGMLRHSQARGGEAGRTDLNALLRARVKLLAHTLPLERLKTLLSKLRFDWQLAADLPPVQVVAADVADVIDNLLHNAIAAVDAQRQARALAARPYVPQLSLTTRLEDTALLFTLRDNGIGIAAELQPRLFTPFFTTRAAGEGSGLGLSLGFDVIVKRHGGALAIRSLPGQGTEVSMRLPLTPPPLASARRPVAALV